MNTSFNIMRQMAGERLRLFIVHACYLCFSKLNQDWERNFCQRCWWKIDELHFYLTKQIFFVVYFWKIKRLLVESTKTRITPKLDSHLPKKLSYLLHWKPFKNDEECFLFHLKSSFHSQVFKFLSWIFG